MNDLAPYTPSAAIPWDRRTAGHLLRRAGFAPASHEVERALASEPAETVRRLVAGEPESPRHEELDAVGDRLAVRGDIDALRGWWLLRLRHTRRPLHARMAVFWHDHFATSNVKVARPALMYRQLRTFETHALGRFSELVRAIARDPAMIVFLDGDANVKGRPNENWARELLELFTLGVGAYSELDVREAARAFTGWHQKDGRFRFVARDHDHGEKLVLGTRGPHDGDDVVALTVARPACARFLGAKLAREFVCPEPPASLVDAIAAELVSSDYDLASVLPTVLGSVAMFDPSRYRARMKSPVEHVIGLARSLDLAIGAQVLARSVSDMGQRLFEPPSVKGWDDHRAWLNSATMLVRMNAAAAAVDRLDAAALRSEHDLADRATITRFCGEIALDGVVPDALRERLATLPGHGDDLLRAGLRCLLTSPEYQLA